MYELESKMGLLRDWLGEKRVTELDEAAVETFLKDLPHKFAPRYRANIRTKLSQLLNFCRRQKWIIANPVEELKPINVPRTDVEILSVQQCKAFLQKAHASDCAESVLPYVVVSLLAGLRPFEAQRLNWQHIDLNAKQLTVLGSTSKTRETRFVDLEPAALAWLKPYRKKDGPIVGPNFRKDFEAVREAAEIKYWPKDILRHSFASFWLAVHDDRARLAEQLGNSLSVVKKHYRKAVQRQIAEQFWKLRPKSKKPVPSGKVIEFPSSHAAIAGVSSNR